MDQKLNGTEHDVILIPKILHERDETGLGFIFARLQFSIMLAY